MLKQSPCDATVACIQFGHERENLEGEQCVQASDSHRRPMQLLRGALGSERDNSLQGLLLSTHSIRLSTRRRRQRLISCSDPDRNRGIIQAKVHISLGAPPPSFAPPPNGVALFRPTKAPERASRSHIAHRLTRLLS